jgi:hypothetical protein
MITLLVVVSECAFPSLDGSISLLSAAYYAFCDSFYYSLSFASSCSAFVFTAYLYSFIILINLINLTDLKTLVAYKLPLPPDESSPGHTSAALPDNSKPIKN